jgi:hypothetical protein
MERGDWLRVWKRVLPALNEAQRRWYAAEKAHELGWGGVTWVSDVTGFSRVTITKGIAELRARGELGESDRIRAPGGGRKRLEEHDPGLLKALKKIMDGSTAGDPMSLLRWTHKSTGTIAEELTRQGHSVSDDTIGRRLAELGYSLQSNFKNNEGESPAERDKQFRYINVQVQKFLRAGQPVLSVDAKKKEKVGNFKNPGKTWLPKGEPREVNVYDFPRLAVGKATPYGAYDIHRNEGLVNVGVSHDTAEFAVESLRQWWRLMGRKHYPKAHALLVCADSGGSNGSRNRGWKLHLQELADELGIRFTVCHYPPGTSKWNKIEHRMFSFISLNWRGQPLETYETVVNLIGGTKTKTGLRVKARLDPRGYEKGVKVPDEQIEALEIQRHRTHPKWNYTIVPRLRK